MNAKARPHRGMATTVWLGDPAHGDGGEGGDIELRVVAGDDAWWLAKSSSLALALATTAVSLRPDGMEAWRRRPQGSAI